MNTIWRGGGGRRRKPSAVLLTGVGVGFAAAVATALVLAPASGHRRTHATRHPSVLTSASLRRDAPPPNAMRGGRALRSVGHWHASTRALRQDGAARSPAGAPLDANGRDGTATSGVGAINPLPGPSRIASERAHQRGVSLTPSKTQPYWACPRGTCEAIVDPPAHFVAGRWRLADSAQALEGSGQKGGYDPQDLQSAYSIPTGGGEAQRQYEEKQTIAVIEVGGHPYAESDLAEYRAQYGLPACTKAGGCLRVVNQQGEAGNLPAQWDEWELEASLDLDMASAACPHCHILLAESTVESLESLAATANSAARLGATEISNSYGLPKKNWN